MPDIIPPPDGAACMGGAAYGLGAATGGLLVAVLAELLPKPLDDDLDPDDDLPPPLGIYYILDFKL